MAVTKLQMTDEQRKSVALEYLKAFDNKGVTSNGGSILDLFADDAQVFFPKWGLATGKKQIAQLFTDFGGNIRSILHDYASFNYIMTGRRPPGRSVARRRVARGPLVRRVRSARFSHPAVLHIPGSGLRRSRHGALSLAVGRRTRRVETHGVDKRTEV